MAYFRCSTHPLVTSTREAEATVDVKQAIHIGREYVKDVFSEEDIADIGLEEVVFDDDTDSWRITIGFSRPWDNARTLPQRIGQVYPRRAYKVVCISDVNGQIKSITDRLI